MRLCSSGLCEKYMFCCWQRIPLEALSQSSKRGKSGACVAVGCYNCVVKQACSKLAVLCWQHVEGLFQEQTCRADRECNETCLCV